MRFCPHCGASLVAGAKFCVECGRPLAGSATGAPSRGASVGDPGSAVRGFLGASRITAGFIGVFVAITVIGLAWAAWILWSSPAVPTEQIASVPPTPAAAQSGPMPAGHPKVELPPKARELIEQVNREAQANPTDVGAWTRLGVVAFRAAIFDPDYYRLSEDAFTQVIKLDPNNTDALRGLGDINYDRNNHDQAILAYEQYLKHQPDDPNVLTDVGTMYLYAGKSEQAIARYKKAVALNGDHFQAWYNMGIAYGQGDNAAEAKIALKRAYEAAQDDNARTQVKDVLTRMFGENGAADVIASAKPRLPAATAAAAPAAEAAAPPPPAPTAARAAAASTPSPTLTRSAPKVAAAPSAASTTVPSKTTASPTPAAAAKTVVSAPTEKATATATPKHTTTPTPSPTAKATLTPTASASASPTPSPSPSAAASPTVAATSSPAARHAPAPFEGAFEKMVRSLPIAGPKVDSVQWPADNKARVLMNNFPMEAMPDFARAKFLASLKQGIQTAKKSHSVTNTVEVEIVDSLTGKVMQTVAE
jgi:tetratricopeptide (TPR) repeat protein